MIKEEIFPFEEASVLCCLLAVFYGHSQRQISCKKYLDPNEEGIDNTHAILYLLKEEGLPLDHYSFTLGPLSTSPKSIEIEEVSDFFMGLTEKAKAMTSHRAQKLVPIEAVFFNIRRVSIILSTRNGGFWWLPLIALLHKKAKELFEARSGLNSDKEETEEEFFHAVRDDLYQRIRERVYNKKQDDLIDNYSKAWERVKILLGKKNFL